MPGPIHGIKVLDLTRFIAGPFCSMLLSDMGAEVIKIEPLSGDDTRNVDAYLIGGESSVFLSLNRGKRSLSMNLEHGETLEVFLDLVRSADVVIHNYIPGKDADLGIDYESVRRVNPGIIYCALSAFGDSGPYRNRPGLDMVLQAMGGIMAITGEPEGRPMRPGFPVVDATSGIMAAFGIALALFDRQKNGKGTVVDLSLLDHTIAIQTTIASLYFAKNENPPRLGNASPFTLAKDFETRDGRHITLSIGHEGFWQRFRKVLGCRQLTEDSRFDSFNKIYHNMEDLTEICKKRFLEKDGKDWETILVEGGIPCSLVNTYEQVFDDKQVKHNQMVFELEHPTAEKIKQVRNPLIMDKEMMMGNGLPPPLLGEHSREILLGSGYDNERIDFLKAKGFIKCADHKTGRK